MEGDHEEDEILIFIREIVKEGGKSMEFSIFGWLAGFLADHFPEEEKTQNFVLL